LDIFLGMGKIFASEIGISTWQRAVLTGTYSVAAIVLYLSNGTASAYANWAAVGLIGLVCWEFEPVLTAILGDTKARPRLVRDGVTRS